MMTGVFVVHMTLSVFTSMMLMAVMVHWASLFWFILMSAMLTVVLMVVMVMIIFHEHSACLDEEISRTRLAGSAFLFYNHLIVSFTSPHSSIFLPK